MFWYKQNNKKTTLNQHLSVFDVVTKQIVLQVTYYITTIDFISS